MNTTNIMKIGSVDIYLNENSGLIISKNACIKYGQPLFSLLLALLVIGAIIFLIVGQSTKLSKEIFPLLCIFLFIAALLIYFYFDIRRSFRSATNFYIKIIDDVIYINGKKFCKHNDLNSIFIQPVAAWKGVGGSYTIGISANEKKKSLIFNQSEQPAYKIGAIIADFLNKKIIVGNQIVFALYKGF